jgi:hypothetical protein
MFRGESTYNLGLCTSGKFFQLFLVGINRFKLMPAATNALFLAEYLLIHAVFLLRVKVLTFDIQIFQK